MPLLTVFVSFLVFSALCAGCFYAVPKGADQIVYRISVVLAFVCCWMMWAITYLAQLNPLITPERSWTHISHHADKPSQGGSH